VKPVSLKPSGFLKTLSRQPWVVLCCITVFMSFAGFWAMMSVRENAREHVAAQLNLILDGSSKLLEQAFRSAKLQTLFLASDSVISASLEYGDQRKLNNELDELLQSRIKSLNFLGLVITNSDNTSLYSSDPHLSASLIDFKFDKPLREFANEKIDISQPLASF
jgi:hypothetical protein